MEGLPDNITTMKVAELKKELKGRGLSTSGNKTELIERLQMAVMPDEAGEEDDSTLLAEADDILADDTDPKPAAETPVEESQEKKKVAINRESVLPVATPSVPAAQEKSPEQDKVEPTEETPVSKEPQTTPTGKKRITAPDEGTSTSTKITVTGTPAKEETETNDESKESSAETVVKPLTDADRAAARAARFGVTPTSDKKASRAARFGLMASNKIGESPAVDLDTLKKRAERFGQSSSNTLKKMELEEQIKKRQDRFGESEPESKKPKIVVNQELMTDEKLKKRAERFGTEVKV